MDTVKVYEALKSLWDTNSLDSTFTGGVWFNRAKSDATFPHVIVTSLGNTTIGLTSNRRMIEHGVLFSIYHRDDNANDPVSQLGVLATALNDVFDEATVSLATADGSVLHCLAGDDDYEEEEDRVFRVDQEYELLRVRPRP